MTACVCGSPHGTPPPAGVECSCSCHLELTDEELRDRFGKTPDEVIAEHRAAAAGERPDALSVKCPRCGAAPGAKCRRVNVPELGAELETPHGERTILAVDAAAARDAHLGAELGAAVVAPRGAGVLERPAIAGEVCKCGRPAVVVYLTEQHGPVPYCGIPDGGAGAAAVDVETGADRRYRLWVKRLAAAEAVVEREERRLSRVLGRLLPARQKVRTLRRKLEAAELERLDPDVRGGAGEDTP